MITQQSLNAPPNHSLEPWKNSRISDGPGQLGAIL